MTACLGLVACLSGCLGFDKAGMNQHHQDYAKRAMIHPDASADGFANMSSLSRYDLSNLRWLVFEGAQIKPTDLEAVAGAEIYEIFFKESFFEEGSQDPIEWDESLGQKIVTRANRLGSPVWVIGYSDEVGSLRQNKQIALARAKAVSGLLQAAGLNPEQIRVVGAGISKKYDGLDKNRRVEILMRPPFIPRV